VLNVSIRGVGIIDPTPRLRPGEQMEVTLTLAGQVLPGIRVQVVHAARGLGLAFVRPDPQLLRRIDELTEDLSPLSLAWSQAPAPRRPRR
jgi:hypothetical protein